MAYLKDLYGDLDVYGQVVTREEAIEFFEDKTYEEWIAFTAQDISKIEFK